ncbi:unnamed protein product [Leptidea sinapis]|uniref:Protein downstream neighbor of son homolog n=1 Tax=Leptidea sinapis TaxID=189913 RepID=A0A5E4PXW5_9NEOP|nr:unnamed protein product [Leptidea sinapis]
MNPPSPWKKPSEVMQIHKIKKRKKALQERMKQPSNLNTTEPSGSSKGTVDLDFSRKLNGDKRKNPFSKNNHELTKKVKLEESSNIDESNDKTLFALLKLQLPSIEKPPVELDTEKLTTFSNILQKFTADHTVETQHIPSKKYKKLSIDWALKTKLRLMSPRPFPWSTKLKASEEASGITGFVRCLDTSSSSTLDTSPRARFHQTCLYWQHPHLPWLNLFPRASGRVAATSFMATNEEVKQALLTEWTESFRSLFQLVRARHCPYFYVCANTFTVLFRAAGLSDEDRKNTSHDSCYDTMDCAGADDDDADEDADELLSQMGLETEQIKKINEISKENENHFAKAFNKENLSDCGISEQLLAHFCSPYPSVVRPLDSVKYNLEDDTYTW